MDVSIPKGTRDFLPLEVARRKWMFGVIESVFIRYGYVPIETPVLENLSTLTGKYGEEGDRLLFKVLNNGDFLEKADREAFLQGDSARFAPSIARRGLRYDLTVPFARYVVMHRNALSLPFKRYQIQPVWRADRPQKGRYQEFYQCDVDVAGGQALTYEAEMILIYDEVFAALGIPVEIRINHRQLLYALAAHAGVADQWIDMTMVLDKLDKIGEAGVRKEMGARGMDSVAQDRIFAALELTDLDVLANMLGNTPEGRHALDDLRGVMRLLEGQPLANRLRLDFTLARGLGYYTGCIFEVSGLDAEMGSLGGGGRYDNLTGVFGWPDVPGIGISFGAERIYDVLSAKSLFPKSALSAPQVLLAAMDEDDLRYAFRCVSELRRAGIRADLFPDTGKLKKPLKYASDIGCPYVAIIGETERLGQTVMLKNLDTGHQEQLSLEGVIGLLGPQT